MFSSEFRPLVGGAARQVEKLSKALVERGLRVTVLTTRMVDGTPEREEDDGVVIHRFPIFDMSKRLPGVRGIGPVNLLSIRMQTMRAVSKHLNGSDIVHTHIASPMTAFAMQAARQKGIPVLCKVAMADERTDLAEVSGIGFGGSYLARAMIQGMNRWVATTQAVRRSLIEWRVTPEKIVMIPNGVDMMDHRLTSTPKRGEARRFLYLGRLSSNIQRDVPTLIRAFDRLADHLPEVQLDLVGDGDLYQETAALVAQTRNSHRIQMPGIQEPGPWLDRADCFVLPSRREGLSNALLEAMAHRLACIANDILPNREVLDDGNAGILVPVGDENSLYNALLRMAKEPGRADRFGEKAAQRARTCYSIDAIADRYTELYGQLIRLPSK